jgi:hypothetical protein
MRRRPCSVRLPIVAALFCLSSLPLRAQISRSPEYAAARRELDKELAPLKALDAGEMRAVAALVLASRAGLDVVDYCPPLRHLDFPERIPCLGAMASYVAAEKECKTPNPTPRSCPKLFEAEGNWLACDLKHLQGVLRDLKGIAPIPRPPRQ